MICPILSQAARDKHGNVVWDHHECIETACTFWADDVHDCGIRASGLAIITRARAATTDPQSGDPDGSRPDAALFPPARAVVEASTLEPIVEAITRPLMEALDKVGATSRDTGLKLLEGVSALEEPLKATGQEMGGRLESLNAAILGVTTTVEGKMSRIGEGLDSVRRAMDDAAAVRPAWIDEMEGTMASLTKRLGGIADRFNALSDTMDTLATQVSTLRAAHEEISASLSEEAGRRKADADRRLKDDARELNARGVGLFYRGAAEAAEAAFRRALELDPGFAEAHNNLGLALSKLGREQEAEASFLTALELDSGLAEAMNNLGFLFHKGMQFEKAEEMFRRSAQTAEDSSLAYTNLGNACYKLGKYAEAVDAWNNAMRQDPLNEAAKRALTMFQQTDAGQG